MLGCMSDRQGRKENDCVPVCGRKKREWEVKRGTEVLWGSHLRESLPVFSSHDAKSISALGI